MNELKKITYNCHKATYLIDKKLIGKITFRESVELRIHLWGCDACKAYVIQSQKINVMIRQLFKVPVKPEVKLDEKFKNDLRLQIGEKLNKKID